jgi:shikimate dehydrogenase
MFATGNTKCVGLLGHPVHHSRSPKMHNAALNAMGLDWVYLPFDVAREDLTNAVAGLWALGCQGFNVTIPHKEAVCALLPTITPAAQQIGAVNTVLRTPTGWVGTNTDGIGFLAGLPHQRWDQKISLILGNGGSARAVIWGCLQANFKKIYVWGRDPQKLQALQAVFPMIQPILQLEPHILATADLVVNTTPLGMLGAYQDRSPLTIEHFAQLPPHVLIYDLVYTPEQTLFLQQAQQRGLATQGGLTMLVAQGAKALQLWTQQDVPIPVMLAAVREQGAV